MRKVVPIGLFALLVYHTLATVIVVFGNWWLAENDLSERLLVYRSVDSLVEFEIPLKDKQEITDIAHVTSDGFAYNGRYYSVISMDIQGDLLRITSLELEDHSFWHNNLLAFLNEHLTNASGTDQKSNQFLKLLLKEYSLTPQCIFRFMASFSYEAIRIPYVPFVVLARTLPIYSPPPEI